LLAQGIAQFGANRADRAVTEERDARLQGQVSTGNAMLGRLLGGEAATPAPPSPIAPEGPGNTQVPVESPTAPVAPIQGSALAPANPAGTALPPTPAAPQAPQNPLGPTPGEAAIIERLLASGDPAQVSEGLAQLQEIEARMAAPPEFELRSINGVEFGVDPRTLQTRQVFEGGVPEVARRQVRTAEAGNPYGFAEGTGFTVNPDGTVTPLGTPPANYVRRDGRLLPEEGGPQDLGGNPLLTFDRIREVRTEIRPIIDQARQLQRNIAAVRAGIRAQNGAGDIAIINGVQKMIDEGVVREGDVALQLQAQGLEGGIAGLQGYLTSQGPFSPQIRAQLSRVAEDLYTSSNSAFQAQVLGYRDMVERRLGKGTFEDVAPSSTLRAFGWLPAESPPAAPVPSRPAAPSGNNGNVLRQRFTPEQAMAERERRLRGGS
jgi:hypothetical protein